MHRPSWLRKKHKSKSDSLADPSRSLSSTVSSKSELTNDGVIAPRNLPEAEQPKLESGRSLWDQAYNDLRNEQKDLVEAFETMLKSSHQTDPSWNIGEDDPRKREKQMSALVDEKVAFMNDNQWRIKICGRSVAIREQVDRVVKIVLVAKDFITPLANLDPIHAGLPWAGVCMLLPLVVKDSTQRAAAMDGLGYISHLIPRCAHIEHVYLRGEGFPLRDDLEAAITMLYTQIMEFEARAASQFNRNSGHQAARNIVEADRWDSILTSIKKSEEECDKLRAIIDVSDGQARMKRLEIMLSQQAVKVNELLAASSAQDEALLAEIKAMRIDQKASFETQNEMDCHQCLRTVDYKDTMEKNLDRVPGTCEWFLQHPRYIDWLNGQASNLLWVTADPGCGKSVLSKFLVKDFRSWMWKDISICYFFFKDDREENRSATHALCSILHQLFEQNPALLKHAMPEFSINGNQLSLLFQSLWKILLNAAADPVSGDIVCILDALDESTESSCKQIVESITDFQSIADGKMKIKFLLTSRPNDLIWRTFFQTFFRHERDLTSIQLMGENEEEMKVICEEINLLVDAKVGDFKKLRSSYGIQDNAHVAVKAKLDEIENRTYLWIALIFPELDKLARNAEDDLLDTINRIPSTVDEAYEKMLSNSSNAQQARRLLHIVCAASRPLTLAEMNRALTIRDKGHLNALVPAESFGTVVRDLCGLFVSIQNSRIFLIHQTAKDFLIRGSAPETPSSPAMSHEGRWKNSLELTESHLVLAQICMFYFFSSRFESDPLNMEGKSLDGTDEHRYLQQYATKNEFLFYAARQWATHFRKAEDNGTKLSEMVLELCNPQSKQFKTWFPFHAKSSGLQVYPRKLTSLHVVSYLGLEELVRSLLARDDVYCDSKDEDGQTPLSWAARQGHHQTMKLLLARHDVDPDSRDKYGYTPLRWATTNIRFEAAKLMLAQDSIDPNSKDNIGTTPLLFAVEEGRPLVAKLLLEQDDVDVNCKDAEGRTPLSIAVEKGRPHIVKLLLERGGVDPNYKDAEGRTPLLFAAEEGRPQVAKVLLKRGGVDPNSKDAKGRTPLLWAVKKNREPIVELLLEQDNVDLNCKDEEGRTPLWWAVRGGYVNLVKLLLEQVKVHPNSRDDAGSTPLSCAARYGKIGVIKILLARDDVDPDSKDFNNRTPLSWAAENGVFLAMAPLLAQGADPDSKDVNNRTPLSWAAGSFANSLEVAKLLLARDDVDPDSKDINNRTPLSYAAQYGNYDGVKLLLAQDDVDPDLKDVDGHTPTWWALRSERSEIVELLRAKKAPPAPSRVNE